MIIINERMSSDLSKQFVYATTFLPNTLAHFKVCEISNILSRMENGNEYLFQAKDAVSFLAI